MKQGCYTALITPFDESGEIDFEGMEKLTAFQMENGAAGILAVGTTGESPSFLWEEHNELIKFAARVTGSKCSCIAGTGSNCTRETLHATEHAAKAGVDAVLLVDPYYNGPSSVEIRREYVEPVASAFPEIDIIPYVIPGRTGTQLFPADLAILNETCKNVSTVKEATGSLENMRLTRRLCGDDFRIFSGDDPMTCAMMTDPEIKASGAISVMSNLAPAAVSEMIAKAAEGDARGAEKIADAMSPLFGVVVVKTGEESAYGPVTCKAKNPLPLKTMMRLLGLPSGRCRRPLGLMTEQGLNTVVDALKTVYENNPEILKPVVDFFNVDVEERLNDKRFREGLYYSGY